MRFFRAAVLFLGYVSPLRKANLTAKRRKPRRVFEKGGNCLPDFIASDQQLHFTGRLPVLINVSINVSINSTQRSTRRSTNGVLLNQTVWWLVNAYPAL